VRFLLQNLSKLGGKSFTAKVLPIFLSLCFAMTLTSCAQQTPEDVELAKHTNLELVDWHISGLWVINSPVAWIRVTNYNNVPIHEITFEYKAANLDGQELSRGTYTIEGTVQPNGTTKNFIEQYLGLVDLYTEKLSVKLISVKKVD
jgi:hypothetical protein